jgi:hypothetical protein
MATAAGVSEDRSPSDNESVPHPYKHNSQEEQPTVIKEHVKV